MAVTTIYCDADDTVEVGSVNRLTAVVATSGVVVTADPSTVSVIVVTPKGVSTTYTLGAAQIVKDSVGNYHYDLTVSQAGTWHFTFVTTSPVAEGSGLTVGVDTASH